MSKIGNICSLINVLSSSFVPSSDYVRPNYEATSDAYHILMDYGLSLVKEWGVDRCNIILATQNEESAQRGVERYDR